MLPVKIAVRVRGSDLRSIFAVCTMLANPAKTIDGGLVAQRTIFSDGVKGFGGRINGEKVRVMPHWTRLITISSCYYLPSAVPSRLRYSVLTSIKSINLDTLNYLSVIWLTFIRQATHSRVLPTRSRTLVSIQANLN